MIKLMANENFPLESVKYLKAKGFDIIAIGVEFAGYEDAEVMRLAIKENRTILTFDRDYGELIFKHNFKPSKGVIYLRIRRFKPIEPGKIIEHLLKTKKMSVENTFCVFDGETMRQRKY